MYSRGQGGRSGCSVEVSPMRMVLAPLAGAILMLALTPGVHADTTYTYTGDHFGTYPWGPRVAGVYSTEDRITGSFTVRDGFVPGATSRGAAFIGFGLLLPPQGTNGELGPS